MDLLHEKGQNKERHGIYFIENAEMSYGWGFRTVQNKVQNQGFINNNAIVT